VLVLRGNTDVRTRKRGSCEVEEFSLWCVVREESGGLDQLWGVKALNGAERVARERLFWFCKRYS
jgi:hypothetical protein